MRRPTSGRWRCAGAQRAWSRPKKQFRKVNGFLHLPALRTALDDLRRARCHTDRLQQRRTPPEYHRAATEVLRNSGHPLAQLSSEPLGV